MSAFRLLLLSTLGAFANYAPLLPVVPVWAAHGGASSAGLGATTGVTMAATVGAQFAMRRLIPRFGLRRLAAVGSLLMGLPTFGYIISDALAPVLAVSAVRGMGFGMVTVAGSALTAVLVPAERRGRAVGLYGAAIGVPQLVGLPLGLWAAEHLGFAAVFVVAALLSVAAAPLAWAIREPDATTTTTTTATASADSTAAEPAPPRVSGAGRALVRPTALMVAAAIALGVLSAFLALAPGISSATVSGALFLLPAGITVGRWAAGHWSDRHGAGGLQLPSAAASALGLGALAACAAGGSAAGVLAGAALYGLGFGALQNDTLSVMFLHTDAHRAGTVWNVAYDGGTGIGSFGGGMVSHAMGVPGTFATAAAVLAATTAATAATLRRRRRAAAAAPAREAAAVSAVSAKDRCDV
ncbi:MFS transporter [Streptomyces montanisoli]|uniref:MFS transporter n=1 Tax=Streptomyces montanisoli TaxID=2798581 RepID=A0A940MCZ9_9ACTN|nr:MFS transporter [Streptomyces montanisoli]MBP0458638.1 MFS transporter [Streptomyces montanisoli]